MCLSRRRSKHYRTNRGDSDDDDTEDDEPAVRVQGNHIYFWTDVTKTSALDLIGKLRSVDASMKKLSDFGDPRPSVYVHINSQGGDLDAALGVIDTIGKMVADGSNVVSIVEGTAASAATLISVCASDRRMYPNAYMRVHQLSSGIFGKKVDLDDEHANLSKLEEVLLRFYKSHTTMNTRTIKSLMSREIDLSLDECLKRGLVDRVAE